MPIGDYTAVMEGEMEEGKKGGAFRLLLLYVMGSDDFLCYFVVQWVGLLEWVWHGMVSCL